MARIVVDTNALRQLAASARAAAADVERTTIGVRAQLLQSTSESALLGSALFRESLSDLHESSSLTVDALNQIALRLTAAADVYEKADSQLSAAFGNVPIRQEPKEPSVTDLLFPAASSRSADGLTAAIVDQWDSSSSRQTLPEIPLGSSGKLDSKARSVMIRLNAEQPHVVIGGRVGSGKTELMRNMIVSLAMSASPQELELILIDGKGGQFDDLTKLPHVITAGRTDESALRPVFARIDHLIHNRPVDSSLPRDSGKAQPRLVIFLDESSHSLRNSSEIRRIVTELASARSLLGIHVIASMQSVTDREIFDRLKARSARVLLPGSAPEFETYLFGKANFAVPTSGSEALLADSQRGIVRRFTPARMMTRSEVDLLRRAIRAAASSVLH